MQGHQPGGPIEGYSSYALTGLLGDPLNPRCGDLEITRDPFELGRGGLAKLT
jgi:hypothetical protein